MSGRIFIRSRKAPRDANAEQFGMGAVCTIVRDGPVGVGCGQWGVRGNGTGIEMDVHIPST